MSGEYDSKLTLKGKSIPKTYRIKKEVIDEINSRSREQRISTNQLVNRWLEKCLILDPLWKHLDAMTIGQATFIKILKSSNKDEMEKIGSEMGRTIAKHLFTIYNIEPNWTSFNYMLEEAYSNTCNWFKFKHYINNDTHQLICTHNLNINWSNFIKGYIESMLNNLFNVNPKIEIEEHIVKFTVINQQSYFSEKT